MSAGREMQRPGGRSARVRAAVHQAVLDLLGERLFTAPVPATEAARFVDWLLEIANQRTNPAAIATH